MPYKCHAEQEPSLHGIVRMLGTPRLPTRSDPCFLLQTEDGELYAWGCGPDEGDHQWITPTLVDPGAFQGAKVAMTAGGAAFSSAVMDDGAIYTFGAKGPWYNIVSYV
jgi:alpha-tubulin suppressor-like RCC1 family protein